MKLTENTHLLKINFEIPISPGKKIGRFVNVIIIFRDKITLIDTGVKGSQRHISDYIRSHNREFSEIYSVILSHSHPDHIGSAADIKSITNCKVCAGEEEKEWIENIDIQNRERPVPGFFDLVDNSIIVDELLSDGQEIVPGNGLTLRVIKSPGHSRGSLNLLFREERILFTADSIPLKNDIPNYDSLHNLKRSLEAIRNNSEYDILLTSWTDPISDRNQIIRLLDEGEEYIMKIDSAVRDCYNYGMDSGTDSCRSVIEKLGLPPFFANPITHRAFRSHFE